MRRRVANQVFGGLILIGIGVLFLLRQFGYVTFDIGYLFSNFWPVILIIIGVQGILGGAGGGKGASWIGPLFMLLLGLYFLGRNLDMVDMDAGDFFTLLIPLLLIVGGLRVIFKPHRPGPPVPPPPAPPTFYPGDDKGPKEPPKPLESTLDEEFERKFGRQAGGDDPGAPINAGGPSGGLSGGPGWNPYGGSGRNEEDEPRDRDHWQERERRFERRRQEREERHERRQQERWERHERRAGHGEHRYESDSRETTNRSTFIGDIHMGKEHFQLKNTNISQFIGDTVLDLTNAQIPYGETKINLSAFIGDLKVYIPDDMDLGISVNSSSFIGDMDVLNESRSGFMSSLQYMTPYYKEAGKKIRINISAFIGDIKVKTVG